MKYGIALVMSTCIITCISGQITIDTTLNYKSQLLNQLKQVVINWPQFISNYKITSIQITNVQKIKNESDKQLLSEKSFSLENYGSFYSNNTKELQFHKLSETFVQKDTINTALYDKYKSFTRSYINQADSTASIEFNFVNKTGGEPTRLSEIIFYNRDGIKFDNILFFITPMTIQFGKGVIGW